MEFITSKDNSKIKYYLKLSLQKKERDKENLFTLEGKKLIEEAYKNKLTFKEIFFTENAMKKYSEFIQLITKVANCYIISDEVSNKISLQDTPQGIYAVCKKLDKTLSVDKIYDDGLYIMLSNLQDAGNIGTIIRTADALGANGIILGGASCDIYNQKVLRGSMGSVFRIPFIQVQDEENFIIDMTKNGVNTYASVVDKDANDILDVDFKSPALLLIGNEGNGLSDSVSNFCGKKVTINMKGNTESLNASIAAAILMWEMLK